jgi:hypothetical protein
MAEGARKTWYAGAFLSASIGFTIWLLSGVPLAGLSLALIGVLVATGLYATAFVNTSKKHPPAMFYTAGVIFVGMSLVQMRCGSRRSGPGPWIDLEAQFAAREAPPEGRERQARLHLVRYSSFMTYQAFSHRRIFTSFDAAGVYLAASWPQSLVWSPLRIPLKSIASCRADDGSMLPGHTLVRVSYPSIDIGVRDDDRKVLAWCGQYGIPPPPS